MTLLLDTHAFLWFCQDDPLLSTTAKALIEDASNRKLLSVASCWEIAIKAGLRKLKLGEPSAAYIPAALSRTGIELLPISLAHVYRRRVITAPPPRSFRPAARRPVHDRGDPRRQRGLVS